MELEPHAPADLVARLATMPASLAADWAACPDHDAPLDPGEPGWTPRYILAHLRASTDILEPRIYQVLIRDNPPLTAWDERRWVEIGHYLDIAAEDTLLLLRLRRQALCATLAALPPAAWARTGIHEEHGPVTLYQLATYLADHDEEHCGQLAAGGA